MKKLLALLFALASLLVIVFVVGKDVLINVAQAKRSATLQAASPTRPPIVSISVCSPDNPANFQQGSCAPGTFDTHQLVLGPKVVNGVTTDVPINTSDLGVGPVPDEHSTVYAPSTLATNQEYLFFLATGSGGHGNIGVSVLSGGKKPDQNGQWTLRFPHIDGYGSYPSGFGPVFETSTAPAMCPAVADGSPQEQDQTFDMHYASAGSIVKDPTAPPGSVLMIYEGANACIGNAGGPIFTNNDDYLSLAIATSLDYGKNWPTYRGNANFKYVRLPNVNKTEAPNAGLGKWGADVCEGNCPPATASPAAPPPDSYGRYAVVTAPTSLATLMQNAVPLTSKFGDEEISGFVDDVSPNPTSSPYLYVNWGNANIARAQLNGGTDRLTFFKWRYVLQADGFAVPQARRLTFMRWLYLQGRLVE